MIRRAGLFLGIAAAAMAVGGVASAQELSIAGTLEGNYAHYDTPGAAQNEYKGSGSAVFTVDNPGINLQANFSNSGLKQGDQSADVWTYDGDAFWRDRAGAFGINGGGDTASAVIDQAAKATDKGENVYHYGMFGEFYAIPQFTLRAKGGRVDGDMTGYYSSAGFVVYPLNSIAISLNADYLKLDKPDPTTRDLTLKAEYMPVRDIPFTVSIGYTYTMASQYSGNLNVLFAGLKWYFGGDGRTGSIADHQRNGPQSWDGPPSSLAALGFNRP
jgi:hypothetical protein